MDIQDNTVTGHGLEKSIFAPDNKENRGFLAPVLFPASGKGVFSINTF
ncbi:hypothetical protein [Akkermansia glycaniphila]|nr:hypothetical protein [Akkermansia glycaniphila]